MFRRFSVRSAALLICVWANPLQATPSAPDIAPLAARVVWERAYQAPPAVHPTELVSPHPGIEGLFFDNVPYQGNPTRVFAWMGIPPSEDGRPVPGIILIHGGKGTAFVNWVKLWNDRGYAAIAYDTSGSLPFPPQADPRPRHAHSGPGGWGGFHQAAGPVADHWTFHAVTAAIRAHALLRSQPGVDPARIGATGVSWGGYLTAILAGVDPHLAFAAPVYGCGFTADTTFGKRLRSLPPPQSERWLSLWDPVHYLPAAKLPILWVNGTNDAFFFPPPWQASHQLAPGTATVSLLPNLPHNQQTGSALSEVAAFADSVVRGAPPLPRVLRATQVGQQLRAPFVASTPVVRAELVYTTDDSSPWPERPWTAVPARLGPNTIDADLPQDARHAFLNLIDERGLVSSSDFIAIVQ